MTAAVGQVKHLATDKRVREAARARLEPRPHVLRLAVELAEGGKEAARPSRLAASEFRVEDGAPLLPAPPQPR
jgi:hypothetical protein